MISYEMLSSYGNLAHKVLGAAGGARPASVTKNSNQSEAPKAICMFNADDNL
jgi:hypothetical protein